MEPQKQPDSPISFTVPLSSESDDTVPSPELPKEEVKPPAPQPSPRTAESAPRSTPSSNPSSIYDFLVKDMMQSEDLIIDEPRNDAQANFQKFSNSFREEQKPAHAASSADHLFKYFQEPNAVSEKKSRTFTDQDTSMLNIVQNIGASAQRPQGQPSAQPMSYMGTQYNQQRPAATHTFSEYSSASRANTHFNGQPIPPMPAMSPTFAHPQQMKPAMAQQNHHSGASHAQPYADVARPTVSAQQYADAARPAMSTQQMMPTVPTMSSRNTAPSAFAYASQAVAAGQMPHPIPPALATVSCGPKNAPGVGSDTSTVLSSFTFNLPAQGGVGRDGSQSNFTFPALRMTEVSPATLYDLQPAPQQPDAQCPQRVGAFLNTLDHTTKYTLNLISSSNTDKPPFNELQIATLHCTFIINPALQGVGGIDSPYDVPQGGHKENSPYTAPTPYHVIQFRPLISQVTYIPVPEYLFDIQSTTFEAAGPADDGKTFNDYYNLNNVLNSNIKINASHMPVKHAANSLFIGQTTYRTTPSVLNYIFKIICKIDIIEVEVMRKQPCAFFYVYLRNEAEMTKCIDMLHKRILFDLHGVWFAQNDREEQNLRKFVRIEREKMFPVLPLPKQCMVVERRNGGARGGHPPPFAPEAQRHAPRPPRWNEYAHPPAPEHGMHPYGHVPQQHQAQFHQQYNGGMHGYSSHQQQFAPNHGLMGYPGHHGHFQQGHMNGMPPMHSNGSMQQMPYGMGPMGHHAHPQHEVAAQRSVPAVVSPKPPVFTPNDTSKTRTFTTTMNTIESAPEAALDE